MAVNTRNALVLRGVVVRTNDKAVNLRLGTEVAVGLQTPEIRISMRRPSWQGGSTFEPAARHAHADHSDVPGAVPGAGRSRRLVGALSRSRASLAGCPCLQAMPRQAPRADYRRAA